MRSKKSKVLTRVTSASTPAGVIASTALGPWAIFVFLAAAVRLAIRRTAMTSETSDSIAATTSPAEVCSSRTRRRTRLRDSASAGNSSSASKAAVSRRPWPSLSRAGAAAGAPVAGGTGFSTGLDVVIARSALHGLDAWLIGTGGREVEEIHAVTRPGDSGPVVQSGAVLIGGHVSTAGGLVKAWERGIEFGCDAIQIFNQSPRMWRPTKYKDADIAEFRERMAGGPIKSVVIHAVYLINAASKDREVRGKSLESLKHALRVGDAIGADGVVFHPGSTVGEPLDEAIDRIGDAVREVLAESESCPLLLEDTAGAGGTVG